jgi:hypothetical protein
VIDYHKHEQRNWPLLARKDPGVYPEYAPRVAPTATAQTTFLAPLDTIREQNVFGCCEGEACAVWLSRLFGFSVEGKPLWEGARRTDRQLGHPELGTFFGSVIKAAELEGCASHNPDDYKDTPENWANARLGEDLSRSLEMVDNLLDVSKIKIESISTKAEYRYAVFDAAQQIGGSVLGMVITSGIREPFFHLGSGEICTSAHIGGYADGHAQAVAGCDLLSGHLFADNWWGTGHGGLWIPKSEPRPVGRPIVEENETHWIIPAAYRMDATAIDQLWEIFVIKRAS